MPTHNVKALIFDVDGTLAETEEIHRWSFNAAFKASGLSWDWDKARYGALLSTTGGKERIARFAAEQNGPVLSNDEIATLHGIKNQIYGETVGRGGLALRTGVAQLIAAAKKSDLKLGIATTTSRQNLTALLSCCFGPDGNDLFDAMVCGEDVERKKPDPEVYRSCLIRLGLDPHLVIAFEDSGVGLKAALAAGIRTVVTPSAYTAYDDFTGADCVRVDLSAFRLSSS
jgi:HAD superfamily hydrolase (TIGR01509 family)